MNTFKYSLFSSVDNYQFPINADNGNINADKSLLSEYWRLLPRLSLSSLPPCMQW